MSFGNNNGAVKAHSRSIELIARFLDIFLLWAGLVLAHNIMSIDWTFKSNILFMLSLLFFQIAGEVVGLYLPLRNHALWVMSQRLVTVLLLMFGGLVVAAWFSRQPHFVSQRMLFALWLFLSGSFLISFRIVIRLLLKHFRKKGFNTRKAVIVGGGHLAVTLLKKLKDNVWMGIEVTGIYEEQENTEIAVPYLGDLNQVVAAAKQGDMDYVYIVLPMSEEEKIRDLVDELMDTTVSIFLIPDFFSFNLMNARQENIDGLPAISLVDSPLTVAGSISKRLFDIALTSIILFFIAVPMLIIAAAVKLTSPGPAIFRQQRYGIDGKSISVWKFRSMNTQDNGSVVMQATQNDARLTSIGGFLRRTSLDELPQFINVLQGHMSIVGPRPHAVAHNELYRSQIKGYMLRHKMKPGITGWAQVNGFRGETDTLEKMEKRIQYDLEYINSWSLILDIRIILMTLLVGFSGKNVY